MTATPPSESFSIDLEERQEVVVATIRGYFTEEAGQALAERLEPRLAGGRVRLVVDLGPCDIMNSPGVACLMETIIRVQEDFAGRVVLTGISTLLAEVFAMAGVTPLASTAPDLDAAVSLARS